MKKRGSVAYRYGFNGKEQDGDIDGTGVDYDYGFRIYDGRIGRFLSVDPLQEHFPWNSDYAFSEGDPINYIDLDGREKAKSNANAGNQSSSAALKAAFAQGASDAFHNSLSIGILDALPKYFGGTDNAKDYEQPDEKGAYYRGRIAGDALAAAAGNVEQDVGGGMAAQGGLVTVGSGGTGAAVGGGEALVGGGIALHGTFVITVAGADAAIATGKLFQLNMAAKDNVNSATNNSTNNANGKNPEATNSSSYLTSNEFEKLPNNGEIDAKKIRFSQNSINSKFKGGSDITDLVQKLKNGEKVDIPPVRIVEKEGQVYTLDNRRLYVYQQAGVEIPYQKLDHIPKKEDFKFTTTNDGTSIEVRK